MKIWTTTVDDVHSKGIVTSVHLSEQEARDMLRANYADGEDVSDLDLLQHIIDQGCELYLEEYEIEVPEEKS